MRQASVARFQPRKRLAVWLLICIFHSPLVRERAQSSALLSSDHDSKWMDKWIPYGLKSELKLRKGSRTGNGTATTSASVDGEGQEGSTSTEKSAIKQLRFEETAPPNFMLLGYWNGYYSERGPITFTDVGYAHLVDVSLAPGHVNISEPCRWLLRFETYYRRQDPPVVNLKINGAVALAMRGGGSEQDTGILVGQHEAMLNRGDKAEVELASGSIYGSSFGLMRTSFIGYCRRDADGEGKLPKVEVETATTTTTTAEGSSTSESTDGTTSARGVRSHRRNGPKLKNRNNGEASKVR